MSVLVDSETRLLVQGMTGNAGLYHLREMRQLGTRVVAGIRPGRGGEALDGTPLFDSVREACAFADLDAALVMVPARAAVDAGFEALDAGIPLVVLIAEGVPVHDSMHLIRRARERNAVLIGPNTPGLISPGKAKIGIMPLGAFMPGPVGVASRSGTLSYETSYEMTRRGIGQSTFIGVGGDMVRGTSLADSLRLFEADPGTRAVVMIGEVGGNQEETAARDVVAGMTKPVVALIAGRTARPGRKMGHAGALVSGGSGSHGDKVAALQAAGVQVADSPADVAARVANLLGENTDTARIEESGA